MSVPCASELERAAQAGTPEAIGRLSDRAVRSLQRFDARMASLGALDVVASYFDEAWVAARRVRHRSRKDPTPLHSRRNRRSAADARGRTKSSDHGHRVSARLNSLFRTLRSKENELAAARPDDLDPCVRRTIAREARLRGSSASKAAPRGSPRHSAINGRSTLSRKPTRTSALCNRELLMDGIDAASCRLEARVGGDHAASRTAGAAAARVHRQGWSIWAYGASPGVAHDA